ncbi:MAG TPA: alcohol dehydrogenase catalytic domain-containing protein, partial [Tepidisphaeraceae bacterium]
MMKAIVFDQALRFDAHRPEPAAMLGDSLIKVHQAGVCATDIEITRGYMDFSGVLGHEFVGTVLTSPDEALVGKRVCGEINCACGKCNWCQRGLSNHCPARTVLGIVNHDGAFAEYVRLPARNLHALPAAVDNDQAVFVEPLAAAFQVLKQVRIESRSWVTVLGDGRLGLLTAQVLRNAGAPVRLIGRHADKMALCEKWQIHSRNVADIAPRQDQDVVVDCTGSAAG